MKTYAVLDSLEQDLGFSAKTLYGLSNNLDKHYSNTYIPKRDGSKRKLSIPDLILKSVQRSIADNILADYPISRYAMAYTRGSNVQKNAAAITAPSASIFFVSAKPDCLPETLQLPVITAYLPSLTGEVTQLGLGF